ncbi:hypothetical protein B0J15DRAFT_251010 [Fusarium solani]|uniref:Uncharacterized protein n=1 Tax=Fusarium solani TaxID=169388 RepID=A0A9P9R4I8_FUSSL|nr:uncharacterized protein B0J15DRAFT_251010 [Fusarium solani]KAH7266544.1 hypothetical protein B0J15DRAFT_251010 [Fusarium solani]
MAMRRRVGNRLEHVEQRNRASYPNEYKPSGAQANDLVTERGQTGTTELRRSQESQEQVKEARTLKITRRKEKKNDRANFFTRPVIHGSHLGGARTGRLLAMAGCCHLRCRVLAPFATCMYIHDIGTWARGKKQGPELDLSSRPGISLVPGEHWGPHKDFKVPLRRLWPHKPASGRQSLSVFCLSHTSTPESFSRVREPLIASTPWWEDLGGHTQYGGDGEWGTDRRSIR